MTTVDLRSERIKVDDIYNIHFMNNRQTSLHVYDKKMYPVYIIEFLVLRLGFNRN